MLTTLTEEQEMLLERVAEEWITALDSCKQVDVADPRVIAGLTLLYAFYDLPLPGRIEVAKSPEAALELSRSLGEPNPHFDRIGCWNAGWTSRNCAYQKLGVLSEDESRDLVAYSGLYLSGVYDTVLLDGCAIVIPFPLELRRDDAGELHSATGPAIRWDGDEQFWWHGVATEEKFVLGEWTKQELLAVTNTEQRRILQERLGAKFFELMGARELDVWTDPSTNLPYALLEYMDGDGDEKARALRKTSPVLQNGSQPVYVERVNVLCETAQAARKWQATRHLHATGDDCARACNADPVLTYGFEA